MKNCVPLIKLSFYAVCPLGFYGDKCSTECVFPWYGELCGSSCTDYPNNCSKADCHRALGCQNNGQIFDLLIFLCTKSKTPRSKKGILSLPCRSWLKKKKTLHFFGKQPPPPFSKRFQCTFLENHNNERKLSGISKNKQEHSVLQMRSFSQRDLRKHLQMIREK